MPIGLASKRALPLHSRQQSVPPSTEATISFPAPYADARLDGGTCLARAGHMIWFSIKLNTEALRLSIGGELDGATLPELETILDRIVLRQPWKIELELSRLRMIDSIGVGALVRFSKRLQLCDSLLIVTGLRDQPALVFRLLGLDRRLATYGLEHHWS